jgi:HlyD family secretion protein
MAKLFSKQYRKWTIAALAVVVAGAGIFGYRYWKAQRFAVPKGIAYGNGRIESQEVDVAAKLPLRVKEVLVREGDLVKPGQVVAKMDTVTLEADLAQAKAGVAAANRQLSVVRATISRRISEVDLAKIEKARSGALLAEHAGSQRDYDVRSMTVKTTAARLQEDQASLQVARDQVDVALAKVAESQSRIDDATLTSPVLGRVLYRVAEPGEVLAAGGKVLTLVNLEDVYMEIYLPSDQAAATKVGAEARFKVDYEPDRAAAGFVSFVSPEAQFTPKEVETKTEREKLMFRVKIQVPKELVTHYVERIKTGVRGVGYVKVSDSAVWPEWLEQNLVNPEQRHQPLKCPPATAATTP